MQPSMEHADGVIAIHSEQTGPAPHSEIRERRKPGPKPKPKNAPPVPCPNGSFIQDCHINGRKIADVLHPSFWNAIPYGNTDEGIAEKTARAVPGLPSVETLRDGFTGDMGRRRDAVQAGMEPWEAPDPLRELVAKHVGPGMSAKFQSKDRMERDGLRGFEVVKDDQGNPVKARTLVLTQAPKEKAEQRNRFYREQSRKQVDSIEQTYKREGGSTATGSIE